MRNPTQTELLPVHKALDIVLQHAIHLGTEEVPLAQASGRVLAENLYADRPFPPFNRVTMDGIAIRHEGFQTGCRRFLIAGVQAAGQAPLHLNDPTHCIEIMTGAVLPEGADTVIRYEDLEIGNDYALLTTDNIAQGQNIHRQGSDRQVGALIVPEGIVISPGETGVAATIGKASLMVKRLPKVVVISTGDELVSVHETPLPYQIRSSNIYSLSAALRQMGLSPEQKHFKDELQVLRQGLSECISSFDAILLSGGVSEGEFDFVPAVLAELGVQKHFHKVQQRPGKPFWFGTYENRCAIFALPGNPVSSFLGSQKYFRPWLRQSLGLPPAPPVYAALSEDFVFKPNLTYFLQVKLEFTVQGNLLAHPTMGGGSGDLANLSDADAFLELPAGKTVFKKGEVFSAFVYRQNI